MGRARILVGDCLKRLRELDACSVDAVVTDPPYHLTSIVKRFGSANAAPAGVGATGAFARASKGFMGQQWDGGNVAFRPETWALIRRVLKPGGHLIAFSGTRTYHRMAVAIEDAGFEIRDMIAWHYGSGFPKSHDMSKAIDAALGAERPVVGTEFLSNDIRSDGLLDAKHGERPGYECKVTVAGSTEAKQWEGWGTALKPATEPICLARKPISEASIAANVLKWGTGALNIDGCRIEAERVTGWGGKAAGGKTWNDENCGLSKDGDARPAEGRWPANLLHDGSDAVLAQFPTEDGTSAARFFYQAKADPLERGSKCELCGQVAASPLEECKCKDPETGKAKRLSHPTVKPTDLMRWLVRLVTPPGGLVLDPFMGTGSTGIASQCEQVDFVGCELSPDYAAIAEARLRASLGMFAEVELLAPPESEAA